MYCSHLVFLSGYNTVLTFKKADGSYGAFLSTPSSIWYVFNSCWKLSLYLQTLLGQTSVFCSRRLTAFIAKELTEARDIIQVEDSYIQEAMSYLISKQKNSGAWDDPNALYDRKMKAWLKNNFEHI